jgi:ABC-type antimicrobial peptide transport system permease subunit
LSDLYRTVRGLLKAKLFAAGVVLTLGFGIGATTAVFFLIRTAALRSPRSESGNIIAVFALLLIVCVNLMGLLLSHGFARRHDIAVRIALGAPRGVIVRQLLIECACLGVAGGVTGLIIAAWIVDLVVAAPRIPGPGLLDLGTNSTTIGVALGMSAFIAISVGLAAYWASRGDIREGLKRRSATSDTGRGLLPRFLVVAQIALSFVLLTDASMQGPPTSSSAAAAGIPFMMVLDAMALLLAGIGLNGLVAYSAGQRAREIGVRVALGARRFDVMSFVTRPGILLTGFGLGLGIVGSIGLRLLMRSTAAGSGDVARLDPAPFWRATLALAGVAVVATYLPARRVSRIDPAVRSA